MHFLFLEWVHPMCIHLLRCVVCVVHVLCRAHSALGLCRHLQAVHVSAGRFTSSAKISLHELYALFPSLCFFICISCLHSTLSSSCSLLPLWRSKDAPAVETCFATPQTLLSAPHCQPHISQNAPQLHLQAPALVSPNNQDPGTQDTESI